MFSELDGSRSPQRDSPRSGKAALRACVCKTITPYRVIRETVKLSAPCVLSKR